MKHEDRVSRLSARDKILLATRMLVATGATTGMPMRLRAFVRWREGVAGERNEVRDFLAERLPEHMVPATIDVIETWPRLPNGKIDRNALITSLAGLALVRERPGALEKITQTQAERDLCDVVGAVLGRGADELRGRFYELGGDSINAIQVISRLRSRGWELAVRDLLSAASIRACASRMRACAGAGLETPRHTGRVGVLPIHNWLLRQGPAASHYNQSQMLDFGCGADVSALRAALEHVVRHHAILQAVLRDNVLWQDERTVPWTGFQVLEWGDCANGRPRVEREVERLQAGFDLAQGPLFRATLFRLADGDHVFLLAHHLVVDGVSWRIVLEDLATAYRAERASQPVLLPPARGSMKAWIAELQCLARAGHFDGELGYWRSMPAGSVLPGGDPHADGLLGSAHRLTLELEEPTTQTLFGRGLTAFQTKPDDLLLGALALALRDWLGGEHFVVELEGHGRDGAPGLNVDVSRTVGWFTTLYPVALPARSEPLGDHLLRTKEVLRAVPSRGLGYGVLQEMRELPVTERHSLETNSAIVFNYLGNLDRDLSQPDWKPSGLGTGVHASMALPAAHGIALNCFQADGRLRVNMMVDRRRCSPDEAERFAEHFRLRLESVAQHCLERELSPRFSPSDFDLAGMLDQGELDALGIELSEKHGCGLRDVEHLFEMTPVQQGMFLASLRNGAEGAYVAHQHLRLDGRLDVDVLEKSYRDLVARHEGLRVRMLGTQDGRPMQAFLRSTPGAWDYRDFQGLDADRRLGALIIEDRERGFDLSRDPLVRVTLVREGETKWSLLLTFHHISLDGWSVRVVVDELFALYRAAVAPESHSLPPPVPYSAHLSWFRRQDPRQAHEYWRRRLQDVNTAQVLPLLPTSGPARRVETELGFGRDLSEDLRRHARTLGASVNAVTLTAWSLVLRLLGADGDVVVGYVTSGRSAEIPGVERMVGMCVSTLPFRLRIDDGETLSSCVQRVQSLLNEDHAHDTVALAPLQAAAGARASLFDHLYIFRNDGLTADTGIVGPRGELSIVEVSGDDPTEYALDVAFFERSGELTVKLRWNAFAFEDPDFPRRLPGYLANAIGALARQPVRRVRELSLLSDAERKRLLVDLNRTAADFPGATCVHDLFERQAEVDPDRVAIRFAGESVTYRELNHAATRLARALRARGVRRGDLVAVLVGRSEKLVASLLGILKAGAAYVPLDPAQPSGRTAFYLSDSRARLVICDSGEARSVAEASQVPVLDLDDELARLEITSEPDPESAQSSQSLAYVIYTSGSTGKPKGVQIEHRALVNLLCAMRRRPGFSADDVMLAVTTPSFDISGLEMFLPLICGARLIVAPREATIDAEALMRLIRAEEPTCMQATPSTWRMLLEAGWEGRPEMKVLCGGEALGAELARALLPRCASLWNMYGPTETTIWSTCAEVVDPDQISIGRPIENTQAYIVDTQLRLRPEGVAGELLLGGEGLARGYLGRPELTAERFVAHPWIPGQRLYRTGDRCRWRYDGNLECLGRFDDQVKIRGYRIEPGEIENTLCRHPEVRHAAVTARGDGTGEGLELVAFVVSKNGPIDSSSLREYMAATLPAYMIPSRVSFLERLPLTGNGKIDRRALAVTAPAEPSRDGHVGVAPRDEVETALAAIWRRLLRRDRIGIHEDFFQIGGHSLLAVRLMAEVRKTFGVQLPFLTVFEATTIERLARRLPRRDRVNPSESKVEFQGYGPGAPLFHVPSIAGYEFLPRGIAQRILGERPFYDGLRYPGLDGSHPPLETVEELAQDLIKQVRVLAPRGPYALSGFCFGGIVAYEMACRLSAAGEIVIGVSMWDSFPPNTWRLRGWRARLQAMRERVERDGGPVPPSAAVLWTRYVGRRLRDKVRDRWKRIHRGYVSPTAVYESRVRVAAQLAHTKYVPPNYAGRAMLVTTPIDPVLFEEIPGRGWDPSLRSKWENFAMDTSHLHLIQGPAAEVLGERLSAFLLAAEDANDPAARRAVGSLRE